MKTSMKVLMSILAAMICTTSFAAEKTSCKKTHKNCPMNNKKECNCGKDSVANTTLLFRGYYFSRTIFPIV